MGEFNVTYSELDVGWPWRRVLHFHERYIYRRFERVLPTYDLQAMYFNANRRKGSQAKAALDMMPEGFIPLELREASRGVVRYSVEFIEAFELAFELGMVDNGMLAAYNTQDLRASGWTG